MSLKGSATSSLDCHLDALGYAVVRKDVYRTAALTLTIRGDLAALGDCDDIAV